jgi:hypothetical protein
MRGKDITGKKFGKLTAIRRDGKDKNGKGQYYWLCKCDCGKISRVVIGALNYGHIKSCGCAMYQYNSGKTSYKWKGYGDISAHFFHTIKGNAKNRKILFDISIIDIWDLFENQNKKCVLSGENLVFYTNHNDRTSKTASLDRIDSSKGYIINNIRWIHKDINDIKWDFTEKKFLELCYLICNPIKDNVINKYCRRIKHHKNWKSPNNIGLSYWSRILRNAKQRNLNCNITIKDIWNKFIEQKGKCALTGMYLTLSNKEGHTASLDRISNSKGYFKNNIQWVHKDINYKMKKYKNEEILKYWCRRIVEYNKQYYESCGNYEN